MKKILQYKNITIKNFKSIWNVENISLEGNIIPIVGINGAGKSNVLRALNWYYNNKTPNEETKYEVLKNKYHSKENDEIRIEVKYSILSGDKNNQSKIETVLNDIFKDEYKSYIIQKEISTEEEYDEYVNSIISNFRKTKELSIVKIINEDNKPFYDIASDEDIDFDSFEELTSAKKYLGDLIYEKIIIDHTPKIEFFDTKKIIEEFHNNSDNDDNEEGDQSSSLSFKNLFSWTEHENKSSQKYRIIDSILKSTESDYSFEDFVRYSLASSGPSSIMNESQQSQTLKLQKEFNDSISKNGFFKSINSNSNVNIFPSFEQREQTNEFEYDDEEQEDNTSNHLKLTIYDMIQTNKGLEAFEIKDISFKNDGFIFALILFLFIEYLLDEESVILIDEPANFLSDTSVKLLMENFKRISESKNIKFIYTTHSHQTLRKDIVSIKDIKIAQKDKMFNTLVSEVSDIKTNSEEFSIINYEYSEKPSGTDLIRLKFNGDKNLLQKNILFDMNDGCSDKKIVLFANFVVGNKFNIIPTYDCDLLKRNVKQFSSIKNSDPASLDDQLTYDIKESKNVKIVNMFDDEEIKRQVGLNRLVENGGVNEYQLDNIEYRKEMIALIFEHYDNDFNEIKKEMPKTSDNIVKELESKYV